MSDSTLTTMAPRLQKIAAHLIARFSPTSPRFLRTALSIQGHLSVNEITLLHRLASQVRDGCIVEIGSYRGRSTMALAQGSRAGAHVPVFAIEPHEAFLGVLGGSFGPQDRAAFFRSMLRRRAWETVRLVNLPSAVVVQGWNRPVSLLWIDGDHRYESVRDDFHSWLRHVPAGGLIALHDTVPADGGPARVVKQALDANTVDRVEQIDLTCVLRKR